MIHSVDACLDEIRTRALDWAQAQTKAERLFRVHAGPWQRRPASDLAAAEQYGLDCALTRLLMAVRQSND